MFVDLLVKGTPLDRNGTIAEQEQAFVDYARQDELGKIGREEVREERAKKRAEKEKSDKDKKTTA